MVFYARQDTRYLIYLYTRLKNELIRKGNAESILLHACLHQSNDICKKRFIIQFSLAIGFMFLARFLKPSMMEDSQLELVRKARANLNNKHLFCLKVCILGNLGFDLTYFFCRGFTVGEIRWPGLRTSLSTTCCPTT